MPTFRQLSFAAGELTPALHARVDLPRYAQGLRTCKNALVAKHGGAYNRPGTEHISTALRGPIRLVPFIFNNEQTYVLEFGCTQVSTVGYMRVIKDGVLQTLTPVTITGASNANPCVISAAAHGFAAADRILIEGVLGMEELNGREFAVANPTTNSFELSGVDSSAYGTYTSGGTASEIYSIATPYDFNTLSEINWVQSADVVTFVHPDVAPYELARTGDTSWTLTAINFAPSITAPVLSTPTGTASQFATRYIITAVHLETGEESLASAGVSDATVPTPGGATSTLAWSTVANSEYRIYKNTHSSSTAFGLLAICPPGTTSYIDDGAASVTTSLRPPSATARNPFNATGDYPAAVAYIQQRLTFAGTDNTPEGIWMSQPGYFKNFSTSRPVAADDAITFSLAGRKVNRIRHLLDLKSFLVFASGGEHVVKPNDAGEFSGADIQKPTQLSGHGCTSVPPLDVDGVPLFIQGRGSIVRDMALDVNQQESDVGIFAQHLLEGFTIVDWAYQEAPHSIVWMARSDGKLLGLTYKREQQIAAWHQHDLGDEVEAVCVVPEGGEDYLYLSILRGSTTRTIERLSTRTLGSSPLETVTYTIDPDPLVTSEVMVYSGIRDAVFMDSAVTYDGRNTAIGQYMTLTGGTNWDETEALTLTSSAAVPLTPHQFQASDVGRTIQLFESTLIADTAKTTKWQIDSTLELLITGFTSATVVTVQASRTVPTGLRSAQTALWAETATELSGLWHLNGEEVSIFADGGVVASPYNSDYGTPVTVALGQLTLTEPAAVVHVGRPFISDVETLDIESPQGETLSNRKKSVKEVTLHVEKSRGIFVGPRLPEEDPTNTEDDALWSLNEVNVRDLDEEIDGVPVLQTGKIAVSLQSDWNSNGRVLCRQVDPVPMAILAIMPTVAVSEGS